MSMYRIEVEGGSRLVTVDVSGFWCLETISAFASDFDAAVRGMGGVGSHMVVLGFDDADVASGPVIEELRRMIASAPTRARRIAFHASSALKRIQVGRIAQAREEARVFPTRDEAVAWACSTED